VAGTATAWELSKAGHQVTVFEKAGGIAEGASFASTGWIGKAGLTGWHSTSPQWPKTGPYGLTTETSWWRQPGGLRWLARSKKAQSDAGSAELMALGLALANLTGMRLRDSSLHSGADVERSQGVMMVFRSADGVSACESGRQRLDQLSIKVSELDAASAKKLEPGLSDDLTPHMRWWLPEDEVINGRQWLNFLKTDAMRHGCAFEMHSNVTAIQSDGKLYVQGAKHPAAASAQFDATVVCTGHHAQELLGPLGLKLPLLNMNQCALSAQIREPHLAPVSGLFDATRRISIFRTGQRLKVSSSQGIWPGQSPEPVYNQLYQVLNDWFPGSARLHGVQSCTQTWQTTNTFTPDGMPLVGPTKCPGVWLNTGYGSTGWTHAPGVAHLLASSFAKSGQHDSALLGKLNVNRFD